MASVRDTYPTPSPTDAGPITVAVVTGWYRQASDPSDSRSPTTVVRMLRSPRVGTIARLSPAAIGSSRNPPPVGAAHRTFPEPASTAVTVPSIVPTNAVVPSTVTPVRLTSGSARLQTRCWSRRSIATMCESVAEGLAVGDADGEAVGVDGEAVADP